MDHDQRREYPYHRRMNPLGSPLSPSGGMFRLDRPSTGDLIQGIATGWDATIVSGSNQLIVHGPQGGDTYEESLEDALSAAQEALDFLALQCGIAHTIEGVETEHLIWWTKNGDVILRDVAVEDFKVSVSGNLTVTDAQGILQAHPPVPVVAWHESFRYFRLSQTTGDLFDAYRNLYLAVESLLSTVVPMHLSAAGTPAEGEGVWLRRALTQIHPLTVDLAGYALPGSANPIDAVYKDLYAGTRTQLFHSKAGRPILLPHTMSGRDAVLDSLERLGRLYLDLSRSVLSVQRGIGVMTNVGFEMTTAMPGEVIVSDDSALPQRTDTVVNPNGGASFTLPTTRPVELARPGLTTWLGEALASDVLREVSAVHRVALMWPGGLALVGLHEPALTLEDVTIFQVQRSLRLVNQQTVKFRYVT